MLTWNQMHSWKKHVKFKYSPKQNIYLEDFYQITDVACAD